VSIDKSSASTTTLETLNADKADKESNAVRQSNYLNNQVKQDHRNIKRREGQMPGFKSFRRAHTLMVGIGLLHMIRKEQYQHPKVMVCHPYNYTVC